MNIDEAKKTIKEQNLTPIMGIWHYSFNFEHFYDSMESDDNSVYARKPINRWSPRPVFTNKKIDRVGKISGKNPFWMCELTTFSEYLKRRDNISRYKGRNFPTTKTFNKKHNILNGKLTTTEFNKEHFIEIYEKLLKPGHMNGVDLINSLHNNNRGLPEEWLKMIELDASGTKAIGIIINDGKSSSLFNFACVLDKNAWGLYLHALWIKDCCDKGIRFADCGVSGSYGHYKDVLFLDPIGNV